MTVTVAISIMLMRRKSSSRSSIASGTIPTAAIAKAGDNSWKSRVVCSPNSGVVTIGASRRVTRLSTTPTTRASVAVAST